MAFFYPSIRDLRRAGDGTGGVATRVYSQAHRGPSYALHQLLLTSLGRMMRPGRLRSVVEYSMVPRRSLCSCSSPWVSCPSSDTNPRRESPPSINWWTTCRRLTSSRWSRRGRSYVVWIGRSPGAIKSGPPVYVFDRTGSHHGLGKVGDAGDSYNPFVGELYSLAYRAPVITPEEALAYCRQRQAGNPFTPRVIYRHILQLLPLRTRPQ